MPYPPPIGDSGAVSVRVGVEVRFVLLLLDVPMMLLISRRGLHTPSHSGIVVGKFVKLEFVKLKLGI
jgi:hypothetical protein